MLLAGPLPSHAAVRRSDHRLEGIKSVASINATIRGTPLTSPRQINGKCGQREGAPSIPHSNGDAGRGRQVDMASDVGFRSRNAARAFPSSGSGDCGNSRDADNLLPNKAVCAGLVDPPKGARRHHGF